MRTPSRLALSLATAFAAPAAALGQCDNWLYVPSTQTPVQTAYTCVATYTPAGTSVPRLVVGGDWVHIQGADYHRIAQFDGTNWSPMGGGFSSDVKAMTSWASPTGPQLIAAGGFAYSGDMALSLWGIAAWNGASWSAVDLYNLGLSRDYQPGEGLAVTTYQGQLVAGGDFNHAGYTAASNIAMWNGSVWSALGAGMDQPVQALTTWDPDGAGPQPAQLIAAGQFLTAGGLTCNGIARWDGAWHPIGAGLESPTGSINISGLVSWDPDGAGPLNPVIVVAGTFTNASGVPAPGIAYWDGSWHSMGTNPSTVIDSLAVWTPTGSNTPLLIASGIFYDSSPNDPELSPRYWDGAAWVPVTPTNRIDAESMCTYDPDGPGPQSAQLIAAGEFGFVTPNGYAESLARLAGTEWQSFGAAPVSYAGAVFGNQLVMGGAFEYTTTAGLFYGATPDAFNLVQWNGADTTSVGGANSGTTGTVRALKSFLQPGINHNPELVVAGGFGVVAGLAVNNIAHYISSNVAGQTGWFAMGQGLNSTVYALERFNSATYAAGTFTASGSTTLNRIARWDGTAWQPLTSSNGQQGVNGAVYALKTYNGALYAGGSFTTAAGLASGGLARWDGTNWTLVVGSFAGTVYSLEVFGNELIIGGDYPGLANAHNIAKYSSVTNSYANLATGGTSAPVRALCVGADSNLYIGGDFTTAGGVSASHVARWNGSAWSDVRGGLDGPVYALTPYRNEVQALGAFGKAVSLNLASPSWARYTTNGTPWIADQPDNAPGVCVGHEVTFRAFQAPGYNTVTFTWRHNGSPVVNGVTPWGSTIDAVVWGIDIHNVHPQDNGAYDAVVDSPCGSVTTTAGTLHVNSADFNGDGGIGTDADIEDFFACISGFCCPTCGTADFNGDGSIGTDADIEAFFRVIAGGPC
jgi:hypothetical protein